MIRIDIETEFCIAQGAVTDKERTRLLHAGVAPACFMWGWIGAATALMETTWQPLGGGERVFVVPARIIDPVTPEWPDPLAAVCFGDIVDLVAFRLEEPERWALRIGSATWLGSIEPQVFDPPPVFVHRTPLDWLRAGGHGLVPLTTKPFELSQLLMPCREIRVSNELFAGQIKRALQRPWPLPRILVPADGAAA
jgi:hypothetical protein